MTTVTTVSRAVCVELAWKLLFSSDQNLQIDLWNICLGRMCQNAIFADFGIFSVWLAETFFDKNWIELV